MGLVSLVVIAIVSLVLLFAAASESSGSAGFFGGIFLSVVVALCIKAYSPIEPIEVYHSTKLATEEEKEKLFQAIKDNGYRWNSETKTLEKLIEPKFKVGNRITLKNCDDGNVYKIIDVKETYYVTDQGKLPFYYADSWELVPDKFDINTLVPFESRVLVRNDEHQYWIPAFWGCKRVDGYITTFGWCKYCIPYEGNEHLLETEDDCDEFFKTWK